MTEVAISINGRSHNISCDPGQEERVAELAAYVDERLRQIAGAGGAYNDAHLLVLTTLVLADELFDAREGVSSEAPQAAPTAPAEEGGISKKDEEALLETIKRLTSRIDNIATKVEAA